MEQEIRKFFRGDIENSEADRVKYSHDASLFEIKPQLVLFPKDIADVCELVKYVSEHKEQQPDLSLTARSAGTDMSGGAINDSLIVSFEHNFNKIGEVHDQEVSVQPGVFYRDFEPKTLEKGLLLPSYPASRELCMLGGMLANNSGGEKSLIYGKTDRYIKELKVVLRDGQEHTFRPLSKAELDEKIKEQSFEGDIYRTLYQLFTDNAQLIAATRPQVSKNSTGYNIWDVWNGQTFDITKLFIGSQGTLGLITEATLKLVRVKPLSGMLVLFMSSLNNLGEIINVLLPLNPSSLESFDDHTLQFAFRFFYSFHKTLGWKKFIFLGMSFIPVLNKLIRYLPHFPKLVMLVEFEGETQEEIDQKIAAVQKSVEPFDVSTQLAEDKSHEEKFWLIRRESFNLLRKNVKEKHTAPFIDDLVVPPKYLPEFLPRLISIMEKADLLYTIAGHMGDGNFHIIPLMDLSIQSEREKIPVVLEEVIQLISEYHGSLSGEHNDGLIRGPFLNRVYKPEVIAIFNRIKNLFDPQNIFNPHKKVTADWEYSKKFIRQNFNN